MSERFTRLFSLPENLYETGAPVLVAAGALQKENAGGRVFAQLKFRNIQDREIKAVTLRLFLLNTAGEPMGEPMDFQYLDLAAGRGAQFGQRTPIIMADQTVRAFRLSVAEVLYQDNSRWTGGGEAWEPLEPVLSLEAALGDEELAKQYRMEAGADRCVSLFRRERDLWLCPCGGFNREEEAFCPACGREAGKLERIDMEALKTARDARVAEEQAQAEQDRAEAERKAAEERAARAAQVEKTKKILVIVLPVLLIAAIAGFFYNGYREKAAAYSAAMALAEEHRYDEAMEAFALLDFRDSQEMAEQGMAYEKALYLLELADSNDEAVKNITAKTKPTPPESGGQSPGVSAAAEKDPTEPEKGDENYYSWLAYVKARRILQELEDYKDSSALLARAEEGIAAAQEEKRAAMYQSVLDDLNALMPEVWGSRGPGLSDVLESMGLWKRLEDLGNYRDSGALLAQLRREAERYDQAMTDYRQGNLETMKTAMETNQYITFSEEDRQLVDRVFPFLGEWTFSQGDSRVLSMTNTEPEDFVECPTLRVEFALLNANKGGQPGLRFISETGRAVMSVSQTDWTASVSSHDWTTISGQMVLRKTEIRAEMTDQGELLLTAVRQDESYGATGGKTETAANATYTRTVI